MLTTFAWQLKPKTMMGMANSAPESKWNRRTPLKRGSRSATTCRAQFRAQAIKAGAIQGQHGRAAARTL
jgi:hypothetical protein